MPQRRRTDKAVQGGSWRMNIVACGPPFACALQEPENTISRGNITYNHSEKLVKSVGFYKTKISAFHFPLCLDLLPPLRRIYSPLPGNGKEGDIIY
ncbi:hypothetical protein KL86DPRO_60193 [uncultured delta proteobacterium]|uniref:Uncharacterized protein n=1 Tax=uncultured delta proteobacterium TaxID=34034 RepID=A0A212KFL7_9DELT|nr:hypothetical protein KL86DPRO_60193 [uncultured delta proteobacterium]